MLQSGPLRPTVLRIPRFTCLGTRSEGRNKSITAAIERGRSSGDRELEFSSGRDRRGDRRRFQAEVATGPERRGSKNLFHGQKRLDIGSSRFAGAARGSYRDATGSPRTTTSADAADHQERYEDSARRRGAARIESLPYTTAASEFIYGYSSVLAAIKANRRKLHKLYIHARGASHVGLTALVARAKKKVDIREVGDEYLQAFDKASSGRPHNGFILEASPLPVPPLISLVSSNINLGQFEVALDSQSREDLEINGKQTEFTYNSAGWRHPLVLYADGVLDEGNLGAIARSAYFLGVDAIVTPTRQSAPWSHIALKASAGAAEAIPIFKVNQGTDFLGRSARAGWRIYASDAVPPLELPALQGALSSIKPSPPSTEVIYTGARSTKRLPVEHCPVESHPTILMMGAEGTGLRTSLLNLAHYKVGIRHGRNVDEIGVDSLNVSVAASLLCYDMLQKPKPRAPGNMLF
ncbi:hypothetical protein DPSP01_011686 [Paraphaeosphaeria sporulosa]|uniref:rRNA methyltransferase 1, mitochondrial n=1 Tax=Paraphaeosphaeria sporulosa TaxID=1460663 RepID=A0A177CZ45_9PLEO|nr:alpha/beta knot [Paraphaeosphaeria sporulosa]OAG12177.1 alpha/beta knot [Paraphaeosphaeria sporulosa]